MKFGCLNSWVKLFSCKTYDVVGTLLPTEGNTDVTKYTKILKANLKTNAEKHFLERPVISRINVKKLTSLKLRVRTT